MQEQLKQDLQEEIWDLNDRKRADGGMEDPLFP